jgi:Tol biopolymer transport system component
VSLAPGARLGPYEIVGLLGAGGMGEVYRARDTRLDRMVAVKVLATAFASDQQLRERFEREARSIAALNHPHICTLHDIGHEGDVAFLVMEILDGETLAARVTRGALPIDQALRHAIEIAGALDKAHRAGIVHRDLKPGNIMLTKAGAKLLDFGLAKRETPAVAGSGLSVLPTTPPNLTTQGTILGTFQYMAPEQLEGREADARTDIFAFGTVLYEMVTGKKAFEGKSQVGLIGAILERDPAPVSTIQPTSPAALDRVVQRCLAKDPDERWQSAGDLAAQLKWIDEKGASRIPVRVSASRAWIAVAVVTTLVATGLGVAAIYFSRATGVERVFQFSVLPPEKSIFDSGQPGFAPIVSPDGTRLAFTARDALGTIQIWVRPLDTLTPRLLQGTEGASYPFWSPDGRSIAFFAQEALKRVDIAGGPVVTLSEAKGLGGSWHRNGVILFAGQNNSPIFRIAAGGGEAVAVTTLTPGARAHRFPSFLPDGRHFIFSTLADEEVHVGSLDSNETKRLLTADSNALYSPPGELLFIRDGTLLRQSFNATTLELSGEATPIAGQVALSNGLGAFSASETGVLAYRGGPGTSGNVQLAWFDRAGKLVETLGAAGPYRGLNVSGDGRYIAVHRHDGNGGDIWMMESARRGTMSRFTFDAAQDNAMPVWSPDGRRIVFGSLRNGKWGLYEKAANRTGGEQLLVESEFQTMPMSWSPDRRFLVYWVLAPKTQGDLWVMSLTGDKKPSPLLETPFNEGHPQISPNGKWIAYTSNETRRQEIYVRPFPSGDGVWPISVNGGTFARWSSDGTELFYMSATSLGKLMSVKVNPAGPTFEYGEPTALFDSGYVNFTHGLNYHTYAVSPDGQRFLIPRPEGGEEGAAATPVTVVVNWTAAFTR